jgi:hypothetical protein
MIDHPITAGMDSGPVVMEASDPAVVMRFGVTWASQLT